MGSATADHNRERLLLMQYATTRAIAEAATIDEGVPRILQAICETLGWDHAGVWSVDPQAQVLRCRHGWHSAAGALEYARGFPMSVHVPHMKDVEDRLFLTLFQASNSTLAIPLAIIVMIALGLVFALRQA